MRRFQDWRVVPLLLALLALTEGEVAAACLSPGEQRQRIGAGQALKPAQIGRILNGEVIRLRLCEARGALIYEVTVLAGDGRVQRHLVDARSGRVIR